MPDASVSTDKYLEAVVFLLHQVDESDLKEDKGVLADTPEIFLGFTNNLHEEQQRQ